MARNLDASLKAAFAADVVRPAYFLHLNFAEPINLWTGLREITTRGHDFVPAQGKMEITAIEETLDGAQPQATITIENLPPSSALAPQSSGDYGWQIQVINYSTDDFLPVPPSGAKEVKAHLWGAGGGPDVFGGGVGGYTFVHLPVTAGLKLRARIGQGGVNLTTVKGFGGTGQGTAHQHNGGGGTFLFTGDGAITDTDYTRLLAAAGGGGAGGWNGSSGHGGLNGNDTISGGMPTMKGHDATGNVSAGQGGGGGGYKGGAYTGRAGENLWGVGGSGWGLSGLSAPQILATPWPGITVPGPTSMTGYDGLAGLTAQHGLMIIEWYIPVPPTEVAATAKFYLGALDIDGLLIGEPVLLFSGTVDKLKWNYGPDEITASIDLIGAPPIVEATTGQRYTHEGQLRKYPSDLGLEYVAALATTNLSWGGNQ